MSPKRQPAASPAGMMTDLPPRPSGRQHTLWHGGQRAVAVQVGGGLRLYEVGGFAVLDGYEEDEMAGPGRGQVLAPWPNRLAGGRYELHGKTFQVPLNEPQHGNAIHGLVRWSSWDLLDASDSCVRLGHVLWPQPGYPFTLAMEIDYELSDAGLRVTIRAENTGRGQAPYGVGMHPYVRAETGTVDDTLLRVPAARRLEADESQIPTGRLLDVAGTPFDFREARAVGATVLDTAFTGLTRDAAGLARVELRSAGAESVVVWVDGHFDYLMLFTGDTLAEHERRRGIAVAPMTCAPNAYRNGMGLMLLQPGQRVSGSWGISVIRPAGGC